MPTVTSRSSTPGSGCQVRSRCSSSSCGSRRATARTIISTYSAMGRLKTPRALVMTRPRSRACRGQDALDAGRRRVDPAQVRAARQQAVEDAAPAAARAGSPRRRRAPRRRGPPARPPRSGCPGAAARMRSRSAGRSAPRGWASGRWPPARRPARGPGPVRGSVTAGRRRVRHRPEPALQQAGGRERVRRTQALGSASSASVGRASGPAHSCSSAALAAGRVDARHEAFAAAVLLELEVEAR